MRGMGEYYCTRLDYYLLLLVLFCFVSPLFSVEPAGRSPLMPCHPMPMSHVRSPLAHVYLCVSVADLCFSVLFPRDGVTRW